MSRLRRVVVDTNVAIVANGRNTHANLACQLSCIEELQTTIKRRIVVVDDHGLIFAEYKDYLNFIGEPGVGDAFFKHLFNHEYDRRKVLRVTITPLEDEARGFAELPVNHLDRSDRKLLAAAVVAKATVLNATDRDWHEQAALVQALGVPVTQVCPQYGCP